MKHPAILYSLTGSQKFIKGQFNLEKYIA